MLSVLTGLRRCAAWAGSVGLSAALLGCSLGGPSAPTPRPIAEPPTPSVTSSGTGAAAGGVATDPAADPALRRFYRQRLAWSECGDGIDCGTLSVPLDYAEPGGATVGIEVVRTRATDPGHRLGSLVVNPGGPGASGTEYARAGAGVVGRLVLQYDDLVGFDPRGVATSDPVTCLNDSQVEALLSLDPTPDDRAEQRALQHGAGTLADGCRARGGALARHVDTVSAARDMDVLRAALGDRRLSFVGRSYGTFLGATYADLFPHRVGRFVLDGALDPTLTPDQTALGQAVGFEQALRAFAADCACTPRCPLRGTVDEAVRQVQDLLASADARPLETNDPNRPLTEGLATLGVVFPLYLRALWPRLSSALAQAQAGDGTALLRLADAYTERSPGGGMSNMTTVAFAVGCLDRPEPTRTLAQFAALADGFARRAPTFGRYLAWSSLPCATWPWPATGRPAPLRAVGAPPILVVGTTRDPATPYRWAQALAAQLASGRLLTRDGDGHTGYRVGSACVDAAVDAFLVAGDLPADGTRCST